MENGVDLEYLGKKYLPNTPPSQPMDIDVPQLDNQIHQININNINQVTDNDTAQKDEDTLIKEIKEDLLKQKRTQYSLKTRLNVIELVKRFSYSQNKIKELFNISQKSVRRFLNQEMELRTSVRKNSFRLPYKKIFIGNFNYFEEMQLCEWINNLRNNKISVSTKSLILKACELKESFANKNIESKVAWVYRFLKRNGYSIRRVTHKGQNIPENVELLKKEFLNQVAEKRKELNMNFNDTWLIINMDETPVYLDMFSDTTIDFVGAENVSIVTTGREKYRLTVLLSICANGWKLPPLVVVKGESGKTIENKLRKLDFCQKEQIFVYT
jgi:transposase